jgi:hypothetical protein
MDFSSFETRFYLDQFKPAIKVQKRQYLRQCLHL